MGSASFLTGLKVCTTVTLAARGWLTIRWDSPIRSLVWQEDWWSGPIEAAGGSWGGFAEASDPWIRALCTGLGGILLVAALLPWLPGARKTAPFLFVAFAILVLDSLGRWVDAGYTFGMAIEHFLQMGTPLFLWSQLRRRDPIDDKGTSSRPGLARPIPRVVVAILAAAALTFVGHGLYAAGFPAVPLSYQTMTMNILGVENETAIRFLRVAGWLDFLVAGLLVFPVLRIPALAYMTIWGALTAAARLVAHVDRDAPRFGLDPWVAETLVRTPHWLLPLLALLILFPRGSRTENRIGGADAN